MFGQTDRLDGFVRIELAPGVEFYVPTEVARQRFEQERREALLVAA